MENNQISNKLGIWGFILSVITMLGLFLYLVYFSDFWIIIAEVIGLFSVILCAWQLFKGRRLLAVLGLLIDFIFIILIKFMFSAHAL